MTRKRSGSDLRLRLETWIAAHGGVRRRKEEYNAVLGCVIGADWFLPLRKGTLIVHLPADDRGYGFSLNTRFTNGADLPPDANRHSGKWNFSCYEDEAELFRRFTSAVSVHL